MTAPLPNLQLTRPQSVAEAIAARTGAPDAQFIAGGTDLLVNMRRGIKQPRVLVDLTEVRELAGIEISDAGLRIGAGVTVADVARHPTIARHNRAIAQAAGQIAGPAHRAIRGARLGWPGAPPRPPAGPPPRPGRRPGGG